MVDGLIPIKSTLFPFAIVREGQTLCKSCDRVHKNPYRNIAKDRGALADEMDVYMVFIGLLGVQQAQDFIEPYIHFGYEGGQDTFHILCIWCDKSSFILNKSQPEGNYLLVNFKAYGTSEDLQDRFQINSVAILRIIP